MCQLETTGSVHSIWGHGGHRSFLSSLTIDKVYHWHAISTFGLCTLWYYSVDGVEIVENSKNAHKIDHHNIICIFDVFLLVLVIHRRHRITISIFQYDDVQNYVRVCWSQLLSVFLFEAKCFVIWRLGLVRGEGNFTLSSHHSVTSPANGEGHCLPSPKLPQKTTGIFLRQFWRGQTAPLTIQWRHRMARGTVCPL